MESQELRDFEKVKRRKRRNEKFKKRNKARKVLKECFGISKEDLEDNVVRMSDNLRNCSCNLCVSGRKSECTKGDNKLTLQERRFLDMTNYDIKEGKCFKGGVNHSPTSPCPPDPHGQGVQKESSCKEEKVEINIHLHTN